MYADLDTLLTALYVRVDDLVGRRPQKPGRPPRLSTAEVVTLAVAQALLGFTSERRWLRHVGTHLNGMFPYLPGASGYNKRLRNLHRLLKTVIRDLAQDTTWWTDDVWLVDSTPVECGRSRPTVQRSDLAGWAGYGYCASHTRYFWGLRLHLICTPAGLPVTFALANPKIDEREVVLDMLDVEPELLTSRPGQTIVADKGYASAEFEAILAERHATLIRPAKRNEPTRPGAGVLSKIRQLIESVNDTLKGQLNLEAHGGRTTDGVAVRVLQRLLALTAAIWHNDRIGAPISRSLIAYDH